MNSETKCKCLNFGGEWYCSEYPICTNDCLMYRTGCLERELKRIEKENDMNFNDVKIVIGNKVFKPDSWEVTQSIDKYPHLEIDTYISSRNMTATNFQTVPSITNVIFNPPATIVFWSDKTKTVVKCDLTKEEYDPEKGLAMAISRKMIDDNKREYYNTFLHWLKKWEKQNENTPSKWEWDGGMYDA